MRSSELVLGTVRYALVAAVVALAQLGHSLQVTQLQQAAQVAGGADTTAIMAMQQQQQQQVAAASQMQQAAQNKQQPQQQQPFPMKNSPENSSQTPAKQTSAKSNHRLVNKLKDARHRRRNRHHRHRHHIHAVNNDNKPNFAEAQQLQQGQQQQQQGSNTLTALESIVEEVSRAGQLPASPTSGLQQQAQQQQQQPQPPQVSNVVTASEILLDGSSSPITHLQQASGGREQVVLQPATAIQSVPQQVAPVVATPLRGATHNSRGFLLTSMLSKIMNVLNVTEFALEMRDGISSRASCMACNAVVGLFLSPLYSKEVFSAAIRTVCTSFKIQTPRVCTGLAEAFQDDFDFIRKNTKLTRDEICGVVFGVDCARRQTYNLFWTVPIPNVPRKPLVVDQQQQQQSNGKVTPLSEHILTNMDDAPDLFEYRKSSVALMKDKSGVVAQPAQQQQQQQQQSSPPQQMSTIATSSTVRPNEHSAPQTSQLDLGNSAATLIKVEPDAVLSGSTASEKSGKMLKRPQYIFDDEHHLIDNESGADVRQQHKETNFVQITDIHIDPYYETGSLNDCGEPLCCRATSGPVPVNDKRRRAGPWGDYGNCDVPVRTLRNALERIREQHSTAEYWIWTGDISPHDIWNISKSETTSHVRLVSKMVRQYSNGVPVFPVIGNHEAHPVNSFAPPEIKGKFSMSWLYDLLADEWSDWLPADALRTLRVGGFYKLHVRKGLRIIALNTNYCARLNPWSFFDPVDPANQLKWLVDELLEAELNQDKVHIIGHVPPDNRECTQAWLFNFINIVDRFKDTILAQFYGHTHRDEYRLIYSLRRQDEPIGVQYIGPSITPFTENNPAYRVYQQDRFGNIVDSETYYFNLTEANASPTSEPHWRFAYNARAHYNMTQGLTPTEWHQFLQRMHDDDELFDVFHKRFYRHSEPKTGHVCRSKCKYSMLSDLRLSHPYKTKPKPFFPQRKLSNHHRDNHHHHHHHHHKRLRHSE